MEEDVVVMVIKVGASGVLVVPVVVFASNVGGSISLVEVLVTASVIVMIERGPLLAVVLGRPVFVPEKSDNVSPIFVIATFVVVSKVVVTVDTVSDTTSIGSICALVSAELVDVGVVGTLVSDTVVSMMVDIVFVTRRVVSVPLEKTISVSGKSDDVVRIVLSVRDCAMAPASVGVLAGVMTWTVVMI